MIDFESQKKEIHFGVIFNGFMVDILINRLDLFFNKKKDQMRLQFLLRVFHIFDFRRVH